MLSIYLELRHSFGEDLNSGMIRSLLPDALDELASCIDEALKRRTEKKLPLADWRDLFVRLESAGLLKEPFTSEKIFRCIRLVCVSWDGGIAGCGRDHFSHRATVTKDFGKLARSVGPGELAEPAVIQGSERDFSRCLMRPFPWSGMPTGRLVHVRKRARRLGLRPTSGAWCGPL